MNSSHNYCSSYFNPADASQRRAAAVYETSDVLFLTGKAGSGKTHVALGLALRDVAERGVREVWVIRPTVECGDTLGYVPGEIDEKLSPWLGPIADVASRQVVGGLDKLPIHAKTLQHLRGRTIANTVAILDEAQNATRQQLRMLLTRLGNNGKIIVAGDPYQRDTKRDSLLWCIERLRGLARVGIVRLHGQHRNTLVTQIDRRLSDGGD